MANRTVHSCAQPARWFCALLLGGFLLADVRAQEATAPAANDEFSPLVKLAPFVVNGQPLAVSIYARTNSDRRYGEEFAERVVPVVHEAVTESTGKGLVIIGAKGEPHPVFLFRKFQALAKDGQLDPAIAASGLELAAMLSRWQHMGDRNKSTESGTGTHFDLDFEKILTALPLPLEGIGAKLYQLAWAEKFDDARVEAKLRALRPGDLERRDLFKAYDWVFYLPPKGAFDPVLDDIIAQVLKQKEVGFFARVAVKSVLLVVKPKIRRAIEAMRQGLMFSTVVKARTHHSKAEVSSLTDAYVKVFMPGEKSTDGSNHDLAVKAVRNRLGKLVEKAKTSAESVPVENAQPESAL